MKRSLLHVLRTRSGRRLLVAAVLAGVEFARAERDRRARERRPAQVGHGIVRRLLPGR